MARRDLRPHFLRIEKMVAEINRRAPEGERGASDFRADLAGLLVVAMAASYETCVKDIMVEYAACRHRDFESFANNNFARLSSRVRTNDLQRYAKLFDERIEKKFKKDLKEVKNKIFLKTGFNVQGCYHQILDWRHEFAHAGVRNTTIKEAYEFHLFAKRVIYIFDSSFDAYA